ncbi:expressed unknown protein [Seminavis robusta]|uniref:Uncharacterized protein n=1 Tax=Seminavis robusta TaxID=568900 RepID=A0A9N8HF81_9STRA|nr:expressed unknown protein [Seminavis robusta]|eukprot:Sro511_g157490.1 n/a (761) ;mRNA; f:45627-48178
MVRSSSKLLRLGALFGVGWALCTWLLVDTVMHGQEQEHKDKSSFIPSSSSSSSSSSSFLSSSNVDEASFSACLLVMDDNHWTIEWLAYHYFALPLGRLIVGVDPRSETSPSAILERWKDRIQITEWKQDRDFMTLQEQTEAERNVLAQFGNISDTLVKHRARQRVFYYKCMKTLKQEHKTWTILIDSDEFLRINTHLATHLHSHTNKLKHASIAKLLTAELNRPGNNISKSPCIQIPRLRFGAVETSTTTLTKHLIPDNLQIEPSQFLTLRWVKHAGPEQYWANKISKVMIDLSQVPWQELVPVESIHRPIKAFCGQRKLHIRTHQSVFVINHYLGSWEQYKYRTGDARMDEDNARSEKQYKKLKQVQKETNHDIQPWLQGFVSQVGIDTARQLLQGVGMLHPKGKNIKDNDPNAYLPTVGQNNEPCAILLFGLPRSFRDIVLPSIVKNIIGINARYSCDYFVHYFHRDQEPQGRANLGGTLIPKEILLLRDAVHKRDTVTYRKLHPNHKPLVQFQAVTEKEFWAARNDTIQKYRNTKGKDGHYLYFPWKAKSYQYPSSLDNIVRQWHSIDGAWKLMEEFAAKRGIAYQRVGMFRSDVMYISPIDLYETELQSYDRQNNQAVLAPFGALPVNDRMFYGPYEAVEIWATRRFQFLENYVHTCERGWAMHSEKFLNGAILPAVRELGISVVVNPDICFLRARADHSVVATDCHLLGETRGYVLGDMKSVIEGVLERNCSDPRRATLSHIMIQCERDIDQPES